MKKWREGEKERCNSGLVSKGREGWLEDSVENIARRRDTGFKKREKVQKKSNEG